MIFSVVPDPRYGLVTVCQKTHIASVKAWKVGTGFEPLESRHIMHANLVWRCVLPLVPGIPTTRSIHLLMFQVQESLMLRMGGRWGVPLVDGNETTTTTTTSPASHVLDQFVGTIGRHRDCSKTSSRSSSFPHTQRTSRRRSGCQENCTIERSVRRDSFGFLSPVISIEQ
jgi:hypothetical protein